MRIVTPLAIVVALLAAAGCTTDAKGANCGLLDTYVNSDDEVYCPDPDAPDDCEALMDETIDAAVRCANGAGIPITEEQLRAELEDGGSLLECENAVATTTSYQACADELRGLSVCNEDGTLEPPATCEGSVLLSS
jgi:hypothetical protein